MLSSEKASTAGWQGQTWSLVTSVLILQKLNIAFAIPALFLSPVASTAHVWGLMEWSHALPSLSLCLPVLSPLFLQVSVEVLVEYPFFVFGQGWSSCCPERTSQLFDLPCSKLSVGDVCISLTLKNLKNGSIKKGQPVDSASILLKHSKNDSLAGSRHRYAEQENGINQGSAQMLAENGELKFPDKIGLPAAPLLTKTEPSKPPATRKRRWSAPETRKLEKSEEEPPLTLPKPSFIPQEVKICIEGRSNVGK